MKQNYWITCFILGFVIALQPLRAQITLSAEDYFQIGDDIRLGNDSLPTIDPGMAGPDQVWDFRSLVADDTIRLQIVDPAITPFADTFPSANLATVLFLEQDTAYAYQRLTMDSLLQIGVGTNLFAPALPEDGPTPMQDILTLEQPELLALFPITFESSFVDTNALVFNLQDPDGTIEFKATSVKTSIIDGWGTVRMPDGDYDALREQVITRSIDSISIIVPGEEPFVITSESLDTSYNFLSNQAQGVLVNLTREFTDDGSVGNYTATFFLADEDPVGQAPQADFLIAPEANTGNVQFTDQSTNDPVNWQWDFGDGNSSTLQNPTHTYGATGTYTVCLTASNAFGSDTTCKDIEVTLGVAPVALFDFTVQGESGEVVFTDQSSNDPTQWAWDFGDGGSSTEQNPTHVYTQGGTFGVQLIASNEFGADTVTTDVVLIVSGINALPDGVQWLVAPNPFRDQLNLQLTGWTGQAPELLIYDAAGRLQHRTVVRDRAALPTAQWPVGTYHYQLRNDRGILHTGQLVKQ